MSEVWEIISHTQRTQAKTRQKAKHFAAVTQGRREPNLFQSLYKDTTSARAALTAVISKTVRAINRYDLRRLIICNANDKISDSMFTVLNSTLLEIHMMLFVQLQRRVLHACRKHRGWQQFIMDVFPEQFQQCVVEWQQAKYGMETKRLCAMTLLSECFAKSIPVMVCQYTNKQLRPIESVFITGWESADVCIMTANNGDMVRMKYRSTTNMVMQVGGKHDLLVVNLNTTFDTFELYKFCIVSWGMLPRVVLDIIIHGYIGAHA